MGATPTFDRVTVNFVTLGGAQVMWEINPHFHGATPWTFQLQTAETDLASGNWVDVGAPVVNTFLMVDPIRRAYGKELNVFYRVKLTTSDLMVFTSPAAAVFGNLDMRSFRIAKEITRKEQLRLKQLHVGVEGFILKAKRSGTPCTECLDPRTGDVTNSNCPTCYGLRWEGGYYTALPAVFGDLAAPQQYIQRDLESGAGMINPQMLKGFFIATPYLSTMDVFVTKDSDSRYHVHELEIRTHMHSVPILLVVTLRLIPFDNIVYTFPVP